MHIFFKEPAENASEELISFKENLYDKYKLYPETFNDIYSLRKQVESILQSFITNSYASKRYN